MLVLMLVLLDAGIDAGLESWTAKALGMINFVESVGKSFKFTYQIKM